MAGRSSTRSPAVEIEVDDRVVRISNPDRVYFPARGETKLDLARYYLSVGPGFGWRASSHFALGGRFSYIRGTGDFDLTFDGTDVLFTVEVRP